MRTNTINALDNFVSPPFKTYISGTGFLDSAYQGMIFNWYDH
ncbi:Uncharacterized protein dnl_44880 [Desulfonema limicola]|uniref:Uncharacterized protein n=1 Tax=Desulfonema limicola TaxID=45656 RepID=A0A975GI37_9BACT|nr:Uncharacterized protein dnl_44880 [Desulfonema limicola]